MKEEAGKLTIEKSILGHCTLTILNARHEDAGLYKCKIDNTRHVTKCNVSFKGFVFPPGSLRYCVILSWETNFFYHSPNLPLVPSSFTH